MTTLCGCSAKGGNTHASGSDKTQVSATVSFNADSAYRYVERQVAFGPRVPNSDAHCRCGEWLESELRRHGADVILQNASLEAFDGTRLNATNILGRFNPECDNRILLLAHWDTRPWADQDPDPANHKTPVDGANDGGSGVGVLLEIARIIGQNNPGKGIDILFVDAEDYGTEGDDMSWALGARHFVENPPVANFNPRFAVLLDMVGGKDAVFCREYFSEQAAPELASEIWATAHRAGYGNLFLNRMGGAVTDDHVQLIAHGIPAIDIIEYHPDGETGFNPGWHTLADNMEGIDRNTLKAVGQTMTDFIFSDASGK